MHVWFTGGEVAKYRELLRSLDVTKVALNLAPFYGQRMAIELSADWLGLELCLYASKDVDGGWVRDFVAANDKLVTRIIDTFEIPELEDDERLVPVWNGASIPELELLGEEWAVVAVMNETVGDPRVSTALNMICRRVPADLMVLHPTQKSLGIPWASALCSAWIQVQLRRELQVVAQRKLHRFSNAKKAEAAQLHQADIRALGFEPAKVVTDTTEALKLAVRSWEVVAGSIGLAPVVAIRDEEETGTEHPSRRGLATVVNGARHDDREQHLIPTMAVLEVEDTEDADHEVPVLAAGSENLRACDTCVLQTGCPSYESGARCAYKIPVRLRTRADLLSVMQAMLEMQTQRIFFGRLGEELSGQVLDQNLSSELERFMRMMGQFKDVTDTRDVVELNIRARGAGAGAMSRIFGERVGESQAMLTAPLDSNRAMAALGREEIDDAELIEDR